MVKHRIFNKVFRLTFRYLNVNTVNLLFKAKPTVTVGKAGVNPCGAPYTTPL